MTFRSTLTALGLALLLLNCSKEPLIQEQAAGESNQPLTKKAINAFVQEQLKTGEVFRWETADDHLLWSAVVQSDSIVAVGYTIPGEGDLKDKIHLIDVQSEEWTAVRKQLINRIVAGMNRAFPGRNFTAADLMAFNENRALPFITMKIYSPELLAELRDLPEVRYVEPMGYTMEAEDELNFRSDSGCGATPASSIPSADFTTVSPSVKVPWNFYNMNIPNAWNTTTGAGVTVCLIDTGTSPNQPKVGSQFNYGQSQGRSLTRLGTYVSSWWPWSPPDGPNDLCGHGTQMAGLLAAPRGFDGTSVGVAYNANLLAIRATGDVVVNSSSEKNGVANALVIAGNTSNVKVISMSIGDIFWSSTVADGVYYAFNNGKLMFAAAGTSTWFTSWYGVVFPASMNETVAVTGIKDGSSLVKCNSCHSGSKVDFVAVMQRATDNARTSLTLAMSGNQPAYVGGSSAATATVAGIATLVWSTNPGQSRTQVLNRLKNASQFYPNNRHGEFGWGKIDAAYAVNNL